MPSHTVHVTTVIHQQSEVLPGSLRDAIERRMAVLTEVGIPHSRDGDTIQYREDDGTEVTLTYRDADEEVGA